MRVLTRPNVGGPTLQAAALWREHQNAGVDTLLAVGQCAPAEAALDLQALGVPRTDGAGIARGEPGFAVVPELGNDWSPRRDRGAVRALVELARAFRPDVVHTHTTIAGWIGRRAARRARVPVVAHTFHGHVLRDYFGRLPSWLLARLEAYLARRTDLLFAVSPSCADELARLGVAARARLLVVPPAGPLPEFLPRTLARERLGAASDRWLVACVGRLVPIKRVGLFVAALAELPECEGHVHGDGPLRQQLEGAARGGRVRFFGAGTAPRDCLPAYDALVVPSAREGCPLVAVEAFAAGVPVVGFDVPGVRDVLSEWGGGVLVEPSAGAAGLAAALRRLCADAGLRDQVTAAGRAGLARFRPGAVAAELFASYSAALARIGYAPAARG
jgi:glycosyltransferase involved in cell wall biosynthesis